MSDIMPREEHERLPQPVKDYIVYQTVTKLDIAINGNGKEGLKQTVSRHDVIIKVIAWAVPIISGVVLTVFSLIIKGAIK